MNLHIGIYLHYEGMIERLEPMIEELATVIARYGFANPPEDSADNAIARSIIVLEPHQPAMPMEEWLHQLAARSYAIALPMPEEGEPE